MGDSIEANFDTVAATLHTAAADAVTTLRAGLFSESASTRIRAAVAIVNLSIMSSEIKSLEDRLLKLERRLEHEARSNT
jgi:hypothetical protein